MHRASSRDVLRHTAEEDPHMRAAVYVRLSKEDRQGARSGIESCLVQQKNAERAIEAQTWHLAPDRVFVDDDESGAEILRRPQLQALLLAAERRTFDELVLPALDRLPPAPPTP